MTWLVYFGMLGLICNSVFSSDIIGCGGFLKSNIPIDFSKVDVKLYTKQGILKESSDCAPTNGYYFIPLSDAGPYSLKIEPPGGWIFEPDEVQIDFDGVNDPCSLSLDINFAFRGFAIQGKVSSRGTDKGPEGATVLLKSESGQDVLSNATSKNGQFILKPVMPGKYTINAKFGNLKFIRDFTMVTVHKETLTLKDDALVIAGFDIVGSVLSNGEPVKGVTVFLYSLSGNNGSPLNCDAPSEESGALCRVNTDSTGVYRFASAPSGRYRVRPYYASFQVAPSEMEVQVKLAHVTVPEKFLVKGFSVKGRVLRSQKGQGLAGASVLLDNVEMTTTDENGLFQLSRMEPGTYILSAKSGDLQFPDLPVKISPATPELEPLLPSGVRVCGQVLGTEDQPSLLVQVTPTASSQPTLVLPVNKESGRFCEFLAPGGYSLSVLSVDRGNSPDLQYLPASMKITVLDQAITNIEFSQLRATLRGRIVKIASSIHDKSLKIKLKSHDQVVHSLQPTDASFTFLEVNPGSYDVEIESDHQCFKPKVQRIIVDSMEVSIPNFVQTGFVIRIRSSHATDIDVHSEKGTKIESTSLKKGDNFLCLPSVGKYVFTPKGCHGYEQEKIMWDVGRESSVDLIATSHDVSGVVITSEQIPVHLDIKSNGRSLSKLGPLKAVRISESTYRHEFTYRGKEGQELELIPTAPSFVFTPENVKLRIGGGCIPQAAEFSGERGLIVEGKISPALEGVKIKIKIDSAAFESSLLTGADGRFAFGPFKKNVQYELIAEKESYVLNGPDKSNTFQAHKLAQVQVIVNDNTTLTRLSGVLLSLTGGEKYRKNSVTEESGERTFHSLSPGEYFLRPMMKEYKFDPASVIIQLKAGETKVITLTGRRVAFSAFGLVTSLNGDPEPNVPLQAVGQGECSTLQEEGVSDADGAFRIRGLVPKCNYALQIKPGTKSSVYRVAPPQRNVKTVDGDVHDVRFIAFHNIEQTDTSVHVTATIPEHLKTITLRLSKEDHPESPIHLVRLDSLAGGVKQWGPQAAQERFLKGGLLVSLPFLPKDGTVYVVSAESSLNSASHSYIEPSVRFTADRTYLALQMNFHAQVRPVEQESPRHLVAALFVAFMILIYWQLRQGWSGLTLLTTWLATRQEGVALINSEAAAKKKGRPRKT